LSKIALVTGASRGIGRAIATRLAKDGFRIWANFSSSKDAAEALCAEIDSAGGSAIPVGFNVADPEAVNAALEPLIEAEAAPDVVVSNAGITKDGLMAMLSPDEWQSVLDTNLGGFFHVTRACLRPMIRRRSGRVIAIASVAGQAGNPGQVNYAASKAGLIGACKSLAKELASRSITVNAIAPGFIETDMVSELPKDELEKLIPMRRFGKPEDVAAAAGFLASDDAAYITGQVISVNGGMYM
jgi:3-oxoacyl-[acyl-carrier protein] reductase